MYRASLENSTYNNPSRKVLVEFAGNLQFCLLCQGELQGMISIKDLVKTAVVEKNETIKVLSDFALGKGGHYGAE